MAQKAEGDSQVLARNSHNTFTDWRDIEVAASAVNKRTWTSLIECTRALCNPQEETEKKTDAFKRYGDAATAIEIPKYLGTFLRSLKFESTSTKEKKSIKTSAKEELKKQNAKKILLEALIDVTHLLSQHSKTIMQKKFSDMLTFLNRALISKIAEIHAYALIILSQFVLDVTESTIEYAEALALVYAIDDFVKLWKDESSHGDGEACKKTSSKKSAAQAYKEAAAKKDKKKNPKKSIDEENDGESALPDTTVKSVSDGMEIDEKKEKLHHEFLLTLSAQKALIENMFKISEDNTKEKIPDMSNFRTIYGKSLNGTIRLYKNQENLLKIVSQAITSGKRGIILDSSNPATGKTTNIALISELLKCKSSPMKVVYMYNLSQLGSQVGHLLYTLGIPFALVVEPRKHGENYTIIHHYNCGKKDKTTEEKELMCRVYLLYMSSDLLAPSFISDFPSYLYMVDETTAGASDNKSSMTQRKLL